MTMKITASEAKAKLLSLLDEVEGGAEVEITKRGRIVAKLSPASGPSALKGLMAGVAMSAVEDERALFSTDEAWEAR
jgi:prevent-host-death family protein